MKRKRPLTLHHTIFLTLVLMIASIVLGAAALHEIDRHRDDQCASYQLVNAVTRVLAAQLADLLALENDKAIQLWMTRSGRHPAVLALAVIDRAGAPLVTYAAQPEYLQVLSQLWTARPTSVSRSVPIRQRPGAPRRRAYLVRAPVELPDGTDPCATLTLLVLDEKTELQVQARLLYFYMPLVLIAAVGLILGAWWLQREVITPLELLSRFPNKPVSPSQSAKLPTYRADEIGRIARAVEELRWGLGQWRDRAVKLQGTVDSRVAAETRAIALALKRAQRQIWTDSLTRLSNRRLLDERLGEIFEAQRRAGQDLAVVMMDIDNFKVVNDTLGHQAGDEILEFLGDLLRNTLRVSDIAVRYGGDEFVLVLPSVTADHAAHVARRMVALLGQRTQFMDIAPRPSMSAGVASLWQNRPIDAQELIRFADEALYEAKRVGKATVRVYPSTVHCLEV